MSSGRSTSIWVCLSAVLCVAVALEEVPNWLNVCHESNPKLLDCISRTIESFKPYFRVGVPELALPSLEPLHIDDLLVSENTASNGLRITTRNIDLYGGSDFYVSELKIVKFGEEYTFNHLFPSLYVTGTYDISGQILLLPLTGSGTFTGNFTNVTSQTRIFFTKKVKNGEEYIHVSKLNFKLKVGHGSMHLNNLFNGDRVIGDAVNNMINQNFDLINEEILPLVKGALERTLRMFANKMLSRYTHKQLFPK